MKPKIKNRPGSSPEPSRAGVVLPAGHTDTLYCDGGPYPRIIPGDKSVHLRTDVRFIVGLRNRIVSVAGLQGSGGRDPHGIDTAAGTGDPYGIFSYPLLTAYKTPTRLSDKHLTVFLRILVNSCGNGQSVFFSTIVRFHNRLWAVYSIIKPLCKFIVRVMAERAKGSLMTRRQQIARPVTRLLLTSGTVWPAMVAVKCSNLKLLSHVSYR